MEDLFDECKIPNPMFEDEASLAHLEAVLLRIFGEAAWDDSARHTARRVLKTWVEFSNTQLPFEFTTFPSEKGQLVVVKDIEMTSLCAHHLLPFYGLVHVGYVPHKVQAGLSKIPRLVHYLAARPQTQERLTVQIVQELQQRLETRDVMVVIESRHTCMSCRGVRAHSASMSTSLPKGSFFTAGELRTEFLSLIGRNRI